MSSAWDALAAEPDDAGAAIVYDGTGRHTAATAAERLAMAGRPITLFHLDESVAPELVYAERVIWKKRLYELGVPSRFDRRLASVERSGNRLSATFVNELTGEPEVHTAEQVIVEHGTRVVDEVYADLRHGARNDGVTDIDALLAGDPQPVRDGATGGYDLHRIGDCVSSRNIAAAVHDALRLCVTL